MDSSIGELVISGVKLMLMGMGIVYLFLALLVWVIGFTHSLIQRFSPEPQALLQRQTPSAHPEAVPDGLDDEFVAVVSAAIHHHQHTN